MLSSGFQALEAVPPRSQEELDQSLGELSHRWPYFLPDGRHYFFSAANFSGGTAEAASVYLGDLDSNQTKLLFHARSNAVYAPGHILFVARPNLDGSAL